MIQKIRFILIPLLIAFASCSPSGENAYDSLSASEIQLTGLFTISDGDLPDGMLFGTINQLLVAQTGEILIVDTQLKSIHIFDPDGNYLNSEIGEGEGPGEVRQIGTVSISGDNNLLLYDWSQRRMSQYILENEETVGLRHIRDMHPEFYPQNFHITPAGDIYCLIYPSPVDDEDETVKLQKINEEGVAVGNPAFEFDRNEVVELRNESGQLMATTSSPHHKKVIPYVYGDKLILGNSLTVGFELFDLNSGERIDSVAFARPDLPLSNDEKRDFIEMMTERMGLDGAQVQTLIRQMPDRKGKVRMMNYDPMNQLVWLNLVSEEEDTVPEWIAVSEIGELAGQISSELAGPVLQISDGRIYILAESDTGEQVVEVLEYEII